MTLGNMRENGAQAHALDLGKLLRCHHGVLSAAPWLEDFPVPQLGSRMVCIGCETVGADVQPNWKEQALWANLTGVQWPCRLPLSILKCRSPLFPSSSSRGFSKRRVES
jgi:hypothetical protein